MSEEARKRRLTIDVGEGGRLAVLIPPNGSVADACAAAEARLATGSAPRGGKRRRIRTLALADGCELGAEDCIADAVGDGEELRPVYAEGDEAGEASEAEADDDDDEEEECPDGGESAGGGAGSAGSALSLIHI